jgi:hypothetical protein
VHEAADFQDRLAHRLALFFGQQVGELFFLLQNRVAGGTRNRAAFRWRHGGPFFKCALSGVDGSADVINGAFGTLSTSSPVAGLRTAVFALGIDLLSRIDFETSTTTKSSYGSPPKSSVDLREKSCSQVEVNIRAVGRADR